MSHAGRVTSGPPIVEFDVAALCPSEVLQPFPEGRDTGLSFGILLREVHEYSNTPHTVTLLRAPPKRPGACHAAEIPFVFDNLHDTTGFAGMLGTEPPQQLADTMHAAWVSFATTGNPGWPPYEPKHRATMHFDTTPRVVTDPRPHERSLWEGRR